MAQRKALGKGLDALIPQEAKAKPGEGGVLCPLDEIFPSTNQPRKTMDKTAIKELAQSIEESGLLQPLVVRPHPKGKKGYELIAGERRWRAAKIAGLDSVPVIVKEVDDREALALSLVENLQRENLNPIEEADAYHLLLTDFSFTQDEVAKKVGKNRSTVANILRLLKLPEEVKKQVRSGKLSEGHARAILSVESLSTMKELAKIIVDKELSVREAEDLARNWADRKTRKKSGKVVSSGQGDPFIRDLENNLKRLLGTKVKIIHKKNRGKIEIYYYSNEEMERIIELVRK